MHFSLSGKIFVTALALASAAIVLVLGLTWLSFGSGFSAYVAQSELNRMNRLADLLVAEARTEPLAKLAEQPGRWQQLLREGLIPPHLMNPPAVERAPSAVGSAQTSPPPLPPLRRALSRRLALLSHDGALIVGSLDALESDIRRPLTKDAEIVGWLALAPSRRLADGISSRFVAAQGRNLLLIGLGTVLFAGLVALLLGRHLSRPLTAMAATAQGLRGGDYSRRVSTGKRHDELGRLGHAINALAEALETAETGRRRWVQDTAHELRTPLSSLRAELEALQDGVRPVDAAALERLHVQTMTLTALIDDLRALADADGSRLSLAIEEARLWPQVLRAVDGLRGQAESKGLTICTEDRSGGRDLAEIDEGRVAQVLRNLIANSLAYTDSGGRLEIVLRREGSDLILQLDDTPPGVAPEYLPHLFDRFYRVESSRSRATGGRGLGLAICKAIVSAHGGSLEASHSPLGGLAMTLRLPASHQQGPER
ncbi:MAG: ATP-binding protein [Pseudomonadota bacterium]